MDPRRAHLHAFADALRYPADDPRAAPERLALLIAGMAHPEIDINAALQLIDGMAAHMAMRLARTQHGQEYARTMLTVFRDELGFAGVPEHGYYAADNSLLDTVLARRRGLPIMLTLVLVAIGKRLGIAIDGIGLPGHFVARYHSDVRGDAGPWLMDPFNGVLVGPDTTPAYLGELFGVDAAVPVSAMRAFIAPWWAQRILNNLHNAYLRVQDNAMAAQVLSYLMPMAPTLPRLWRERALLYYNAQEIDAAITDIRHYFFLTGQSQLVMGDDAARSRLAPMLSAQDKQLLAVYVKAVEALARMN